MNRTQRLLLYLAALLALILIPFFFWEERFNKIAFDLLASSSKTQIAAAVVLLLTADVLLPVPSSIVSTGAGALLGIGLGWASIFVGMTAGSLAGYSLGRFGSRWISRPVLDQKDIDRIQGSIGWAVSISRPVPVIAEAVTLTAGFVKAPFRPFLFWSVLSNFAVAGIYAVAGAMAQSAQSFIVGFLLAIAVPWVAQLIYRRVTAQ